jgi:hypothetical protein
VNSSDHSHEVLGQAVVLDIGGDTGALVIYTSPDRAGDEIEVCPLGEPTRRTHSQIHGRIVGDTTVHAAVYPLLRAGRYLFCKEPHAASRGFTITGGEVTELDWR